jgi:hypothetical protein
VTWSSQMWPFTLCRELHPSIDLGGLHRHPKCYCHRFLSLKLNSLMGSTTTSNQYISWLNFPILFLCLITTSTQHIS